MALEIGRQVLSGLDSSLGDEAAYKTSRYFIDRWLADLGSSAKETRRVIRPDDTLWVCPDSGV